MEPLSLEYPRLLTGLWKVSRVCPPGNEALLGSNRSGHAGLGGLSQGTHSVDETFGRG